MTPGDISLLFGLHSPYIPAGVAGVVAGVAGAVAREVAGVVAGANGVVAGESYAFVVNRIHLASVADMSGILGDAVLLGPTCKSDLAEDWDRPPGSPSLSLGAVM
jgi:hypothetical protein